MIVWIGKPLALAIHERQLVEHGGRSGIRDGKLLESALARPQQLHAYPSPAPGIADLAVEKVDVYLDDVQVAKAGGRSSAYREADGARVMKQPEITVRALLNRGAATATVWTCDLSHDYVTINAEYRT